MVRINDATGANITVIEDFVIYKEFVLFIIIRYIILFMMNMIIFMDIGGDVQDHAVNGNLFMVMLNDQ
jgi:hypothetical protein